MNEETSLPNSQYINISLGLKYLNNNRKLYLKILNSFLKRYEYFDIYTIKGDAFKNEIHTLKGLSSTLGMELLSNLAKKLDNEQTAELLLNFSKTLQCIILDLQNIQTKTLLIIEDNSDDIDSLIILLENNYDIIVSTTTNDALDSLSKETIDIVVLSPVLTNHKIRNILEQENIFIINIPKPIDFNSIQLAIKNV